VVTSTGSGEQKFIVTGMAGTPRVYALRTFIFIFPTSPVLTITGRKTAALVSIKVRKRVVL